jgi:hypothetical protein
MEANLVVLKRILEILSMFELTTTELAGDKPIVMSKALISYDKAVENVRELYAIEPVSLIKAGLQKCLQKLEKYYDKYDKDPYYI